MFTASEQGVVAGERSQLLVAGHSFTWRVWDLTEESEGGERWGIGVRRTGVTPDGSSGRPWNAPC